MIGGVELDVIEPFDPVAWIERELEPQHVHSPAFIYDHMESQSGRQLPLIYQPFDPTNPAHFADRGAALDFAQAAGGGRVLDFGPGDGWPALIIAPFAEQVVGVEGSMRRRNACEQNALRMGISNVDFMFLPPERALPFPDASFDAIVAASSVEQAPDPRTVLREFHRVLRPGGTLRMYYESLTGYAGRGERDVWLSAGPHQQGMLVFYQRDIEGMEVLQYRLSFSLSPAALRERITAANPGPEYAGFTAELLDGLREHVTSAAACCTHHPSGAVYCKDLRDLGFSFVRPTFPGNYIARRLWDELAPDERPGSMADVDALLRPVVAALAQLETPPRHDLALTAVK
jgi:SAM-dependent methyltransferase